LITDAYTSECYRHSEKIPKHDYLTGSEHTSSAIPALPHPSSQPTVNEVSIDYRSTPSAAISSGNDLRGVAPRFHCVLACRMAYIHAD
jgi:hypothetical protein